MWDNRATCSPHCLLKIAQNPCINYPCPWSVGHPHPVVMTGDLDMEEESFQLR